MTALPSHPPPSSDFDRDSLKRRRGAFEAESSESASHADTFSSSVASPSGHRTDFGTITLPRGSLARIANRSEENPISSWPQDDEHEDHLWDDAFHCWYTVWHPGKVDGPDGLKGLKRLNKTLFAIADRKEYEDESVFSRWFHLRIIEESDGRLRVTCDCPDFRSATVETFNTVNPGPAHPNRLFPEESSACVHHCMVIRYSTDLLSMTPLSLDSDADLGSVVIHYNKSIMPIMMVSAAGHSTEDRKVVSFLHSRKPSRCLRKACNDLPSPCIHRVNAERAREAFLVEQEEGAGAGERAEESIYFKAVKRLIAKKQRQEAFFGLQPVTCISDRTIPYLITFFTKGPRRDHLNTFRTQYLDIPTLFPLDRATARCSCGQRLKGDPTPTVCVRQINLYNYTKAWKASMEMVRCPSCPEERWMASDPMPYGVFMLDSDTAFTHWVMNEYTHRYHPDYERSIQTSCEIQRTMCHFKEGLPHFSAASFQAAYYAFINLYGPPDNAG